MASSTSAKGSILVPSGRKMKSYACMRSLERRGIDVIVATEYDHIPHFSSRFCSERIQLPAFPSNPVAYKDALLEVATRSDVETIVPVRECDTYVLAKYRAEFESEVSLVTPTLETLRNGHDRLRLAREAERAGVPVAKTRPLSDVEEWNDDVVVKSRYNVLTGDYVDAYAENELREVKDVRFLTAEDDPDPGTLREGMDHDPIVQEYIPEADKILYCALWDRGEPLATYQHRQLRKNSWVGGGGVYRESTYSREVDEVATQLLSHLDWHGFACIEYVEDENTGEWKFLEINPRVWQSLPEAVRAGADFPYYYWLRARDETDRIDPEYERGVACHNVYGEAAHLLSILRDDSPFEERPSFARTMGEIVASCVTNPRFEYVRADDPQFFLSALQETLSSGVTRSRQYTNGDVSLHPATNEPGVQR